MEVVSARTGKARVKKCTRSKKKVQHEERERKKKKRYGFLAGKPVRGQAHGAKIET